MEEKSANPLLEKIQDLKEDFENPETSELFEKVPEGSLNVSDLPEDALEMRNQVLGITEPEPEKDLIQQPENLTGIGFNQSVNPDPVKPSEPSKNPDPVKPSDPDPVLVEETGTVRGWVEMFDRLNAFSLSLIKENDPEKNITGSRDITLITKRANEWIAQSPELLGKITKNPLLALILTVLVVYLPRYYFAYLERRDLKKKEQLKREEMQFLREMELRRMQQNRQNPNSVNIPPVPNFGQPTLKTKRPYKKRVSKNAL